MIKLHDEELKFQKFLNNETIFPSQQVLDILENNKDLLVTVFKYEDDSDLIKLMMLDNFLEQNHRTSILNITYMPYSRMDRSEDGSAFTLKHVAKMINMMFSFVAIYVVEPHSDVTAALLDRVRVIETGKEMFEIAKKEVGFNEDFDYVFFPDAGAAKRYGKSIESSCILVGHKEREFSTGKILSFDIVGNSEEVDRGDKVIIVDDLSSKGGTFYHSALKLQELGFAKENIHLVVTHCENSIFEGELLNSDSPLNKVFTTDSHLTKRNIGTEKASKLNVISLDELIKKILNPEAK